MPTRRLICSVALIGAIAAAGCGSSSSKSSSTGSAGQQSGPTTTASSGSNALAQITARGKPTVTVPKAPATKLELHDDVVGTGAVVKPHDSVTVHYVGVGQSDGKQFD